MSEGHSYRCKWERTDQGFAVWVVKRPRLRGEGRTLQQALEDAAGVICEATGDGEPSFSLHPLPPPHPADAPWIAPEWSMLNGNGEVIVEGEGAGLFTGGWCRWCNRPQGRRTDKPLVATRACEGDVAHAQWTHGWQGIDYDPLLMSERFLKNLSPKERACCAWREVSMPNRCKVRYFECIPKRAISEVAVRGWAVRGWCCPKCSYEFILCSPSGEITWKNDNEMHGWLAKSSLRARDRLVGVDAPTLSVIMPTARAAELLDAPASRGLSLSAVGLVPDKMVNRKPRLPKLKQSRSDQMKDTWRSIMRDIKRDEAARG